MGGVWGSTFLGTTTCNVPRTWTDTLQEKCCDKVYQKCDCMVNVCPTVGRKMIRSRAPRGGSGAGNTDRGDVAWIKVHEEETKRKIRAMMPSHAPKGHTTDSHAHVDGGHQAQWGCSTGAPNQRISITSPI